MNISTSVKELFPIHMTLSLTLMILIDWTGANLVDFQEHRHLLKLSTMKTEENHLFQIKTKLHQMERERENIEKLRKSQQEKILLETKLENKQNEIFIHRQQLEEFTNSYREKLAREQQQWLIDLFDYFSKISQIIKTFLIQFRQTIQIEFRIKNRLFYSAQYSHHHSSSESSRTDLYSQYYVSNGSSMMVVNS